MADGGVVHSPSTWGWGQKAREKREKGEGERVSVPSSPDLQPYPFLGETNRVGRERQTMEKPWPAGWGSSCLIGDVIP